MAGLRAEPGRQPIIPGACNRISVAVDSLPAGRCPVDAGLLFRCMRMVGIDRAELAADDPLLFRELQGRCALCPSRDECVHDLAEAFDEERWVRWRMYCPNSGRLIAIGAVQNCVAAAPEHGRLHP